MGSRATGRGGTTAARPAPASGGSSTRRATAAPRIPGRHCGGFFLAGGGRGAGREGKRGDGRGGDDGGPARAGQRRQLARADARRREDPGAALRRFLLDVERLRSEPQPPAPPPAPPPGGPTGGGPATDGGPV